MPSGTLTVRHEKTENQSGCKCASVNGGARRRYTGSHVSFILPHLRFQVRHKQQQHLMAGRTPKEKQI